MIFSYWSELFLSWASCSETYYLRPNWKRNSSKEMHPEAKRKVHRRNLTNTHVRSDFVFDLSTRGRWIPFTQGVVSPELFSSLTSLCPHCQLSTKKRKSFVHLQSLPSLTPPPIKHLSNAKPSPPLLCQLEGRNRRRESWDTGSWQKLGQTGAGRRGPREQSSGSDECVTLWSSPPRFRSGRKY